MRNGSFVAVRSQKQSVRLRPHPRRYRLLGEWQKGGRLRSAGFGTSTV